MIPTCELVEKYKDRWNWCSLCRVPVIHYSCCNNASCNCSGCKDPRCKQEHDEAYSLIKQNLAPTIDQVEGARELQRKHDLGWYIRNRKSIEEEPEWFKRISALRENCPFIIPTEEEIAAYNADEDPDELIKIFGG